MAKAKLEDRLPIRFYSIQEFYDFCIAWNPEFDKLYQDQEKWRKNVFQDQADIDGIRMWEKVLSITPEATDTLEDRRFRIISDLQKRTPYTWNQLHKMLNALCGEGNYELKKGYFTLMLYLSMNSQSKLNSVIRMLQDVVPMHILLEITQLLEYNFKADILAFNKEYADLEIVPYQERETAERADIELFSYNSNKLKLEILPYQERESKTAIGAFEAFGVIYSLNLVINKRD